MTSNSHCRFVKWICCSTSCQRCSIHWIEFLWTTGLHWTQVSSLPTSKVYRNVSSGVFFCLALWSSQSVSIGFAQNCRSLDGLRRSVVSKTTIARSQSSPSHFFLLWCLARTTAEPLDHVFMLYRPILLHDWLIRFHSPKEQGITVKHNKCQKIYIMTSKDNNNTPIKSH